MIQLQMIDKGDFVLVTSPFSKFAGCTGTVKKLRKISKKAIIKIFKPRLDAWIEFEDLMKISEQQQEEFEKIFKERKMPSVLSS